jgi:hypothetical protein
MSKKANYYQVDKFKILDLITIDQNDNPMYHYISIGGKKDGCITISYIKYFHFIYV